LNSGKRSIGIGLIVAFILVVLCQAGIAATVSPHSLTSHKSKSQKINESQHARRRMRRLARSRVAAPTTSASLHRRHRYYERFHTSSFAPDVTEGDVTTGEDLTVRDAAIDALGGMNGTVVAIEPTSGRILAMVNQKLALSSGANPAPPSSFPLLSPLSTKALSPRRPRFVWVAATT